MVVLTRNRWGKIGEERRRRDLARAPWTKSGKWLGAGKKKGKEEDTNEPNKKEESWESCGRDDIPKGKGKMKIRKRRGRTRRRDRRGT